MTTPHPPILGVVGPTASGKTELALALARRLPLEIIVADSRQVVRGMDIGTAKPDADARAAVPHHLIDVVDPDEAFTVAEWVGEARRRVPEIAARGRLPMLVGGTGLYVAALVDGHDYAAQGWSPDVRAALTRRFETEGLETLITELETLDPAMAARIDRRNPRRVLRALERAVASGGNASVRADPHPGRVVLLGLSRPREELARRIDDRARRLFEAGLLDEVAGLIARGYEADLRPMTGHGYREAAAVLAGELSLEAAVASTARRTRQYAKRQSTWFRRDPRVAWLRAGGLPGDAPRLVDEAERIIRSALA